VDDDKGTYKPVRGKTYSLFGDDTTTDTFYKTIKAITDDLLLTCPDQKTLLLHLQRASSKRSFFRRRSKSTVDRALISNMQKVVRGVLHGYTMYVKEHLSNLPLSQRFDDIIRTNEEQYHYYMIEIELINRIYRDAFKRSDYKFALFPHCLRDFRPECRSAPGDIEHICKGCTKECFINVGSLLLRKYDIHPYISITIEQEQFFKQLKLEHPSIGALGITCVPELTRGMRLCIKLGIPPVGIPLDANRCARWMKQTCESSFNLKELERLVR
jgi:hypothetical protein